MIRVMMNLVEQDVCGGSSRYCFDLVRRDIFAPGWKVDVEINANIYNTGGGRRCEFGKGNSCKEKVWTGCNYPCFFIPRVVRSD